MHGLENDILKGYRK